jgi:hypothetical protein
MPLFTNPMNIKHIEKDFHKKLMPYMRKCGNGKFVWKLCITFHINVGICLYGFEFISYNIVCPICENVAMKNLCKNYGFLNLSHIIKFIEQNWKQFKSKYWKQNLSNKIEHQIQMKLKTKFKLNWKQNSNKIIESKIQMNLKQNSNDSIENKIYQMKLKTKFKPNWKQNSNEIIENKIQTKLKTKVLKTKFIKQNWTQNSNKIEQKIQT